MDHIKVTLPQGLVQRVTHGEIRRKAQLSIFQKYTATKPLC